MSDVLLHARGVQRCYDGAKVVDVDDLIVRRGEVLAILGANGSGKSTLFRILLGLERQNAGVIDSSGTRAGVFQKPYLFSGTVADNIAFGLKTADREERVQQAAADFGLLKLLPVSVRKISGGEAQRVALARALVLRPDTLLLDEPSSSLDVVVKRTFREDVLRVARGYAGAVVLITHDPAEAFGLADRIAVMDRGRIVQTGRPEELLDDPRTPFVASFTGAELLLDGTIAEVADDLIHVDTGACMLWGVNPANSGWTPVRGERAHIAYRPEDVMISAPESHVELSARNAFRLRVASMSGTGGLVRLRLEGAVTISALVTRNSVESLAIRPGRDVIAHMKATALRVLRGA